MTTTYELVQYYVGLLILQYIGKPRASATIATLATPVVMPQTSVQTISFALAPTSGHFVVSYDTVSSASINWNDSIGTIQSKIQAITGLSTVEVTGTIAGLVLTVTFTGITPPALPLVVESSTLLATATAVTPVVLETDLTLPLAVQAGFNLIAGTDVAVGAQLDTLGKYAGVTRSGPGFIAQITLDDTDFIQLIRMAVSINSAGSSLATIQDFIQQFFPGQMLVFDYQTMRMTYLISTAVGSQDLIQLFITEGLLPKPMGVQLSVIYAPTINFFGFRTYITPAGSSKPFNTYTDYQTDWPWLTYADAVIF